MLLDGWIRYSDGGGLYGLDDGEICYGRTKAIKEEYYEHKLKNK